MRIYEAMYDYLKCRCQYSKNTMGKSNSTSIGNQMENDLKTGFT